MQRVEGRDNLWRVHLFDFEADSPLGEDLRAYSDKYGKGDVTLELLFPYNYPAAPPQARIIRPRFLPGSSIVRH